MIGIRRCCFDCLAVDLFLVLNSVVIVRFVLVFGCMFSFVFCVFSCVALVLRLLFTFACVWTSGGLYVVLLF